MFSLIQFLIFGFCCYCVIISCLFLGYLLVSRGEFTEFKIWIRDVMWVCGNYCACKFCEWPCCLSMAFLVFVHWNLFFFGAGCDNFIRFSMRILGVCLLWSFHVVTDNRKLLMPTILCYFGSFHCVERDRVEVMWPWWLSWREFLSWSKMIWQEISIGKGRLEKIIAGLWVRLRFEEDGEGNGEQRKLVDLIWVCVLL